ncbi:HIRAN domain-containing protein [Heliophilum fasciatum]|uniref:HipA-like protein n=1 Tax=Heliophilum fasciatum TaxID=35700 RepID=A0A4R2RWD4_9FIRM|nr:HIRAN domain-containing protein [Heliophilum fasciatum]MCW2276779.1 hypothetical protein [Heliophilum fasciatum]TCP68760.1 HipA-like protein [Heliophilum fasciatum]
MTPKAEDRLWLIWQDPQTCLRHAIGELWRDQGNYYFQYNEEKLKEAEKNGCLPHPAFPDIRKQYESDQLFNAFARRLPNKKRPDYRDILSKYALTVDSDDFAILSATGGKLVTDYFEFAKVMANCDNQSFQHDFYVAGWKYWGAKGNFGVNDFAQGERLNLVHEENNLFDPFALRIFSENGVKIGYVPAFYSRDIGHYLAKHCGIEVCVITFEPNAESDKVMKVRITCESTCVHAV